MAKWVPEGHSREGAENIAPDALSCRASVWNALLRAWERKDIVTTAELRLVGGGAAAVRVRELDARLRHDFPEYLIRTPGATMPERKEDEEIPRINPGRGEWLYYLDPQRTPPALAIDGPFKPRLFGRHRQAS
jgi:hypothetical protein